MARPYGAPPLQPGQKEKDRKPEPVRPKEDPTPSSDVVAKFHQKADTDVSTTAIHHTLGDGPNQSSPGAHDHRGNGGALLLEGISVTGSRGGNVALFSLISALKPFGLQDNTTA